LVLRKFPLCQPNRRRLFHPTTKLRRFRRPCARPLIPETTRGLLPADLGAFDFALPPALTTAGYQPSMLDRYFKTSTGPAVFSLIQTV
jgi:hypothetical protein